MVRSGLAAWPAWAVWVVWAAATGRDARKQVWWVGEWEYGTFWEVEGGGPSARLPGQWYRSCTFHLNLPLSTDYRNMSTEHLLGDISVILDALIGVDNAQRQE